MEKQVLVRWTPLYYVSIVLFAASVVLYPINQMWSIITALFLICLWSRIPGFIAFVFNKLALNDLFGLIIAANTTGLIGGAFGAGLMLFSRLFGPHEWMPYTFRASVALFIAGVFTPIAIKAAGGLNVMAMVYFEAFLYAAYYLQILLFWRDEIGLEIVLLPAVLLFDFGMNSVLIGPFGGIITDMMNKGLAAGTPFIIMSGVLLGFIILARNAKRIASWLQDHWARIRGERRRKEMYEFFGLKEEPLHG